MTRGRLTSSFLFNKFWRCVSIKQLRQNNDGPILNEDIRSKEMLVITEEGEKLGILSRKDALAAAQEKGLDLVLIQPQAKPQVAKIMDYSKFRYEQQKKAREQRKNQKVVQIQEIRMTPTIESNDLIVKANKARKILEKGNKIKVSVRFYGRLMTRQDLGQAVLDKFVEELKDVATVETAAKQEGRFLFTTLAPIKK
ncbi:MAG: translation initiation factor IF-3 [Acholeplasmatales bacterium]|nr:translation initiation factor IF-3 [Acholeplasmatales bacterium]